MEFKKILVPIDFSKASLNAATYAVSFAKHFDASVMLLSVVPPPLIVEDSFLAFAMTTQAEIVEKSYKQMRNESKKLEKVYPERVEGRVVEGVVSDNILKFAKKEKADLIVVGRKGKGRSNSIFGSVATAMIKKSSVPVLIIPEKAMFNLVRSITFASDLITGLDHKKHSLLLNIIQEFKSELNILHIQKAKTDLASAKQSEKNILGKSFSKVNYQFHTISHPKVEDGIQHFLSKHPTDILVMISHPHNILQRMLGQTLTKNMSYQTDIPILALKPA